MRKVLFAIEDFVARNVPLQVVGLVISPFLFHWALGANSLIKTLLFIIPFALLQGLCGRSFYNHLITYHVFHKKYIQVTLLLIGIAVLLAVFFIPYGLETTLFIILAFDFILLAILLLGGAKKLGGSYFNLK